MKPIMRSLSPQTKQHITEVFNVEVKRAYARGDAVGWRRGFFVGAGLAFVVSLLLAVIVVAVIEAFA